MINIIRAALSAAAAVVVVLAFGVPANAANLVKNPSFEKPKVPIKQTSFFSPGDEICDGDVCKWKVIGPAGSGVLQVGQGYTCCTGVHFSPTAGAGRQSLCLRGTATKGGGVEQTFKTAKGKTYKLTFEHGNLVNAGQGLGTSSTIKVFINDKLKATKRNTDGTATDVHWQTQTLTFKAAGKKTVIKFVDDDPPGDNYNGLDYVDITVVP